MEEKNYNFPINFAVDAGIGGIASIACHTLFYPFEKAEMERTLPANKQQNYFSFFSQQYKEGGVRAIWRKNLTKIISIYLPLNSFCFAFYNLFQHLLIRKKEIENEIHVENNDIVRYVVNNHHLMQKYIAGGAAGVCGDLIVQPRALFYQTRTENILFYSRLFIYRSIYFGLFDTMRLKLIDNSYHNFGIYFLLGSGVSMVGGLVVMPSTVILNTLQLKSISLLEACKISHFKIVFGILLIRSMIDGSIIATYTSLTEKLLEYY